MGKYTGVECPACHQKFSDDDDIVVCPVCGAPHHRACYLEHGDCVLSGQHEQGKLWKMPQSASTTPAAAVTASEPASTTNNNPYINPEAYRPANQTQSSAQQPGSSGTGQPHTTSYQSGQTIYNPYTVPFAGLNPEEELDGIKIKDLAQFVGPSAPYYLIRFQFFNKTGRRVNFNWSSFFLNYIYFFFRKMTWVGILLLAISLVCMIPSFLLVFYYFKDILSSGVLPNPQDFMNIYSLLETPKMASIATALQICQIIGFVTRAFMAAFANYFYYRFCISTIKKIRQGFVDRGESLEDGQYTVVLAKKGRTSIALCIGSVAVVVAISFGVSIAIVATILSAL